MFLSRLPPMLTDTAPTAAPPTTLPDAHGYFGPYGGMFVPETLMSPLHDLADEYERARRDPAFQSELAALLKDFAGRPTPLYFAERLTQKLGGAKIYFKREDLLHTGAHKINNALGQILLARRMGKKRIIAETGAGQHGVATATAAAHFGLRMRHLHGCKVDMAAPVPQRRPHALPRREGGPRHRWSRHVERGHQRGDARLGHQRPHHVSTSSAAPSVPTHTR